MGMLGIVVVPMCLVDNSWLDVGNEIEDDEG